MMKSSIILKLLLINYLMKLSEILIIFQNSNQAVFAHLQ